MIFSFNLNDSPEDVRKKMKENFKKTFPDLNDETIEKMVNDSTPFFSCGLKKKTIESVRAKCRELFEKTDKDIFPMELLGILEKPIKNIDEYLDYAYPFDLKVSPMNCMLCIYGHITECHYPETCEEALCNHFIIDRGIDKI